MKIKLKAHSEVSALTGGKKMVNGDVVDVPKAKAAEAVKTGRWEEVPAESAPGEGSEGG